MVSTRGRPLLRRPCQKQVRHLLLAPEDPDDQHTLYRNNGDRTFTDVTDAAGVGRADGHGFGVVAADLNGDGRVDLYVANDMCPNFVFLNKGDGTFEDATESSGAGLDGKGRAHVGHGRRCRGRRRRRPARPDRDRLRQRVQHVLREPGQGAVRRQDGPLRPGRRHDPLRRLGLRPGRLRQRRLARHASRPTARSTTTAAWPDSAVAYEEPPHLFANQEGRQFRPATRDAGPYFDAGHVGRGAAFGDVDDDGDVDIIVNHKDGPPALLRNDTKNQNRWIRLVLQGTRSNRDAVGARVEVAVGGRTIHRQRKGGSSMESSNDPRLLIGVGASDEVTRLTVRWPSGAVSTLGRLKTGRGYTIVEPSDGPSSKPAAPKLPPGPAP